MADKTLIEEWADRLSDAEEAGSTVTVEMVSGKTHAGKVVDVLDFTAILSPNDSPRHLVLTVHVSLAAIVALTVQKPST